MRADGCACTGRHHCIGTCGLFGAAACNLLSANLCPHNQPDSQTASHARQACLPSPDSNALTQWNTCGGQRVGIVRSQVSAVQSPGRPCDSSCTPQSNPNLLHSTQWAVLTKQGGARKLRRVPSFRLTTCRVVPSWGAQSMNTASTAEEQWVQHLCGQVCWVGVTIWCLASCLSSTQSSSARPPCSSTHPPARVTTPLTRAPPNSSSTHPTAPQTVPPSSAHRPPTQKHSPDRPPNSSLATLKYSGI